MEEEEKKAAERDNDGEDGDDEMDYQEDDAN